MASKSTMAMAAGLALLGAGSAGAADLSNRRIADAPAPAAYDWSGVYLGAHLGAGFQTTNFQDPSASTVVTLCCDLIGTLAPGGVARDRSTTGFLGGGQAGWAYQIGRLVVGGEVDISGGALRSASTAIIPGAIGPAFDVTERFSSRTNLTATSTTTLGVAQGRWMFYNKAGAAYMRETDSLNVSGANAGFGAPGDFTFQSTSSQNRVGWTVGAGVKWAFLDNWSAKVEYDYLDFASKKVDFSGVIQNPGGGGAITSASTFNTSNGRQISQVKVGLDYRFASSFSIW